MHTRTPRALVGCVRANASPVALIGELTKAFEEFKARNDGKVDDLQKAIDDIYLRDAAARVGVGSSVPSRTEDPEYSRAFATFFRSGQGEDGIKAANATGKRASIQAAMSVGSNQDGGYLAPVEWDRTINKALVALSPMRGIANVKSTTVGAYFTLWATPSIGSGWVGETAARPATTTPSLAPVTFAGGEIFANPFITQRLIDDGDVDPATWLAEQVETEFARQEGIAFISGDGVNKPRGLLTYIDATLHPGGALDVVPSGTAASVTADALIDMKFGLAAPYRQGASWLMSSATAAVVSKLKDGQGNYLWRDAFLAGEPATLLGRTVAYDENMPSVSAGNLAIAFGDFSRGYLINDRIGIRVLRDPYTNKPFVGFYTTKRVGGGVLDPRAIRLMKTSAN